MSFAVRQDQAAAPIGRHVQVPLCVLTDHPRCARIAVGVLFELGSRPDAKISLQAIGAQIGVSVDTVQEDMRLAREARLVWWVHTRYENRVTAWCRRAPHSDQPFVMVDEDTRAAAAGLDPMLYAELLRWRYTIGTEGATRKSLGAFCQQWHGNDRDSTVTAAKRRRSRLVAVGLLQTVQRPGRATITALPGVALDVRPDIEPGTDPRIRPGTLSRIRPGTDPQIPYVEPAEVDPVLKIPMAAGRAHASRERTRETSKDTTNSKTFARMQAMLQPDPLPAPSTPCSAPTGRTQAATWECLDCAEVRAAGKHVIPRESDFTSEANTRYLQVLHDIRAAMVDAFGPDKHRSIDCALSRAVAAIAQRGLDPYTGLVDVQRRWEKCWDPADGWIDSYGDPIESPEFIVAVAASWEVRGELEFREHAHDHHPNWLQIRTHAA